MQTPAPIPLCCCEPCNATIAVTVTAQPQIFPTHGFPNPDTYLFPNQNPELQSLAIDYDPPNPWYTWDVNQRKWIGAPEIP